MALPRGRVVSWIRTAGRERPRHTQGGGHELATAAHADLVEDRLQVVLDGVRRQLKRGRDLRARSCGFWHLLLDRHLDWLRESGALTAEQIQRWWAQLVAAGAAGVFTGGATAFLVSGTRP